MKRSDILKGMFVFINTLKATKEYIGANREMESLIGNYAHVKSLSGHYNQAFKVRHPKSKEIYTIHCRDASLEPKLTGRTETIKVEKEIKARFDIETLYV